MLIWIIDYNIVFKLKPHIYNLELRFPILYMNYQDQVIIYV